MFSVIRNIWRSIYSLFTRKAAAVSSPSRLSFQPYKEQAIDLEYNKLFCDNLALFRPAGKLEGNWKKLFAKRPFIEDLKAISADSKIETSIRILAFKELRKAGVIVTREILGAVIEVGEEEGNEAIGLYENLSAVYISARGKIFRWENASNENEINEKIEAILKTSQKIIGKAEPWIEPRQGPPAIGEFRISFLATDGFYVGQGKMESIESDAVAKALVFQAGDIMAKLVQRTKNPESPKPEKIPEKIPDKDYQLTK